MDSRYAKLIAGVLTLAGTALLIFLLSSIKPTDTRKLTRINVNDLAQGRFSILNTEALRYFVIHPTAGDIYVVAAPVVEGTIPMPEHYWWKPMMKCKDFGLDANAGIVSGSSRFRCRDSEQTAEWSTRWQWDIHGYHVPDADNTPIDDMYRVRIKRSGDEITFTSLDTN